MHIDHFSKVINEEKDRILSDDMKSLCLKAETIPSSSVKWEAMLIARALEYSDRIILSILKNLKGE